MQIDLNLEVLHPKSCKYLTVLDTSFYPVTPDNASLTIVPPGYEQSFLFDFGIRKANIYNSNSFGITTADSLNDLPDGLYTFHYVTCPTTVDCDFYVKGAEAHADLCNPDKATELYIKANELLQRIEEPCIN
jgi:hypothetical protein